MKIAGAMTHLELIVRFVKERNKDIQDIPVAPTGTELKLSPNNTTLCRQFEDNRILFFWVPTGTPSGYFQVETEHESTELVLSIDGRRMDHKEAGEYLADLLAREAARSD